MSGMSLVAAGHLESSTGGPARKETGSTVSSTPPEDDVGSRSNSRNNSASDILPPPSPSNNSINGSAHQQQQQQRSGMRPPSNSMPSPVMKPGHAKNPSGITAATSPLLSLTPNSSVDGNSEWTTTRQPSPHGDAPAIPYLSNSDGNSHRRLSSSADHSSLDAGSVSSLERSQQQLQQQQQTSEQYQEVNDGLLGLGLSDHRSSVNAQYSSSSPQLARGHLPSHEQDRRRERPPLSSSYGDGSSHGGDRSVGGASTGSGYGQAAAEDPRGFGAIARPELRQAATEFDPSGRSTGSNDSAAGLGHISQKFGSLPSLGTHIQQQRGFTSEEMSKPKHMRSTSAQHPPSTVHMDSRMYNPHGGPRAVPAPQYGGMLSSSYDGYSSNKRTSSVPSFGTSPSTYDHPSLSRRDALDFAHGNHGGLLSDEMRALGGPPSMISPGHSPHQTHYGHTRNPSDSSPPILASSPMSMNSGLHRSTSVPIHHSRNSSLNEEEHHLIGEHIDVPQDMYHQQQGHPDSIFLGGQAPSGLHRGHSISMGELPSHYMDSGVHHLSTAGATMPQPKVVYSVKFKRTQRNFVLGPRIARDLKIGTYVKVEADRGEDLGIVVGKVSAEKFNYASRTQYTAGMGPPGGMGGSTAAELKRIIRLATHDEVSLLSIKREEEEELLKICRGKVRQRGLPMNVVDAEYQFDRHKLTFFFEAEGRVDFRELVRDLFSMYKTRIWLQQLDKNTSTSAPAIMSPQQNLQIDYGTPIIAPPSEFADSLPMAGMGDARY